MRNHAALGIQPIMPELAGLGPRPRVSSWSSERIASHVEQGLDLVGAWCRRALAIAWDSGRISFAAGARPFESEAAALVEGSRGRAPTQRSEAEQIAQTLAQSFALDDPGSPAGVLADDFNLSALARRILLIAVAPQLRGELARGYAMVSNDPARAICDELLIAHLLDADGATRRALARELEADAPLVRHGLIVLGGGARPFVALEVLPVVAQRFAGESTARREPDEVASPRIAESTLADLILPPELVQRLVEALARPAPTPARIVIRARAGLGGTSLLAALAERAGRTLAVIDASSLGTRNGDALDQLRVELRRTWLRGLLPCIVGVDALAEDPTKRAALRDVLAAHLGPITFRTSPAGTPPVGAAGLLFDIAAPDEAARASAWRSALDRSGGTLANAKVDHLAAKYRVGPGTIERVVRAANGHSAGNPTAQLETILRQQRAGRIADVATRVTRTASWPDIVLPTDVLDSIREFIARVAHRRTVFDCWGYDQLLTTGRGLTALFSGGPGTGKSMVAGVIARELGYDLYRVDLSRVLSKWIGETEKNLARVFDAAEDGDVVLLFDEADSLFSKRTNEVRSANDRYSNLEVNFLLERLDQFDGIAILTTNATTAIDPAFKRRLSFRLSFPFPDHEMRERLWAVHVPQTVPIEGDLDLFRLASRYELSGGYIRNAAVRAAFLAAQENRTLSQEHLERAVVLEYHEAGRLLESGKLE